MPIVRLFGVVLLWDDTPNSSWMLPGYFDGIIEAVRHPGDAADRRRDYSRTAGQPMRWGSPPAATTWIQNAWRGGRPCIYRVTMQGPRPDEERLDPPSSRRTSHCWAPRASRASTSPWVGTLWQDLADEHPSPVVHHGDKPPYDPVVHEVSIAPDLAALARAVAAGRRTARSEAEADEVDFLARRIICAPSTPCQQLSPSGDGSGPWTGTDTPGAGTAIAEGGLMPGCRPSGPSNGILSSLTAPIATNVALSAPSSTPADASPPISTKRLPRNGLPASAAHYHDMSAL